MVGSLKRSMLNCQAATKDKKNPKKTHRSHKTATRTQLEGGGAQNPPRSTGPPSPDPYPIGLSGLQTSSVLRSVFRHPPKLWRVRPSGVSSLLRVCVLKLWTPTETCLCCFLFFAGPKGQKCTPLAGPLAPHLRTKNEQISSKNFLYVPPPPCTPSPACCGQK